MKTNIENVEIGEDYIPYNERLMSHEEMAKIDLDNLHLIHITSK